MSSRLAYVSAFRRLTTVMGIFALLSAASAQNYRPSPNDTLQSPIIGADGMVTFRIFAPRAAAVTLGGTDIPASARTGSMKRLPTGVWEETDGPIPPGSYRYNFIIDSAIVADPRNPLASESNTNVWSLFHVPGAGFMDTKQVPHGAVSEVSYYSTALGKFRRMHIYTPPGYEKGTAQYPVFYLLHGAFDCDDSWSSVGRAGFIIDNLIAEKKAVPMIIVMPAGHTGPFDFSAMSRQSLRDEFAEDFLADIKPYVESHYRVLPGRANRAMAGLSMGGMQTLNIAIPHLDEYAYIGVFSSGVFDIFPRPAADQRPTFEQRNAAVLDNAELKKDLRLFWFATGRTDFLLGISKATVEMFRHHGFSVAYVETEGGHTWINWREYLAEFAPQLFRQR